jgi:hypothetical protein
MGPDTPLFRYNKFTLGARILLGASTGGSVHEDRIWISFVPHRPLRPPFGYDLKQNKTSLPATTAPRLGHRYRPSPAPHRFPVRGWADASCCQDVA